MKVNILLHSGILGITPGTGIYTAALKFKEKLEKNGIEVDLNGEGYDYDIFHNHWPVPFLLPKILKAKRKGIKILNHAHVSAEDLKGSGLMGTSSDRILNFTGKYLSYFFNQSDLVLTPSLWARDNLVRRGVKKPIRVLSNGVDTGIFKFDKKRRGKFREEHSISEDDVLIYCVGQFVMRKGIETFSNVARNFPDKKFFWIGKKIPILTSDNVRKMYYIVNNRPDNLVNLGFVDDVVSAHSGGDIFFFPSYVENQGIAVLEAAACSKPIILRNLPVYDWAINKKNCMICKNDKEFAESIEILSDDKSLRTRIGKEVKKVAVDNDIGKVIKELIGIYSELA